jgi:hypothetical protein
MLYCYLNRLFAKINFTLLHSLRRKKVVTDSVVASTDYFSPKEAEPIDLIPARKRALHPKVKQRLPGALQVTACEVLVQVVGARNIPLRAEVRRPFSYSFYILLVT